MFELIGTPKERRRLPGKTGGPLLLTENGGRGTPVSRDIRLEEYASLGREVKAQRFSPEWRCEVVLTAIHTRWQGMKRSNCLVI